MRLRELGEVRKGNVVLVHCLGKNEQGGQHCCGTIRVPFTPPFAGCELAAPTNDGLYWLRTGGDSVDEITLKDSVHAGSCGHFNIVNGEVVINKE